MDYKEFMNIKYEGKKLLVDIIAYQTTWLQKS